MSLWLILFVMFTGYTQTPKSKLGTFHSWGFTVGVNKYFDANMTTENPNTNVKYKVLGTKDISFGLDYNLYINELWYMNMSIKGQTFGDKELVNLTGGNSPLDERISSSSPDFLISVPITAIYSYQFSRKIRANIGGGFGLTYYRYTYLGMSGSGNLETYLESNYSNNKNPLYPELHLETGISFEKKKLIYYPKIIYSKSLKDYRRGTYQFTNPPDSPDFGGTFEQSGDYFGFQLGIRFKKKQK